MSYVVRITPEAEASVLEQARYIAVDQQADAALLTRYIFNAGIKPKCLTNGRKSLSEKSRGSLFSMQ